MSTDDEGTATPADMARLLHAGDADRIAGDVRLALADLLLTPKEEREPTQVAIANAILPHVNRLRSSAATDTEGRMHFAYQQAIGRGLEALLEQAAELQRQGVTVTAGAGHLRRAFNEAMGAS